MKLSDKIEVPELDELRLARMERQLVAEVARLEGPTPAKRNLWAGAAGLVAVAGVLLAILLNLRGAQRGDESPVLVLGEPTEVVTGKGQSSTLTLGDATVRVGENTAVTVQRFGDGRTQLYLERGNVDCEVQPRPNRPTFQVLSGDVTVTVIGTRFVVDRSTTVKVRVQRGIVGVATSHQDVKLQAGENWQGSPYANRTLAMLLQDEAAMLAEREALAALAAANDKDDASRPVHKGSSKHRDAKQRNRNRDAGVPRVKDRKKDPEAPLLLSEILKGAKPLPPIFKKSHDPQLAKLREVSARNPKRAVKELESLAATSTGSEASFALYSRAYLLFFRLHKHAAVVTAAKQYARRFPKGAEAEDMLWLRVRASCEANDYPSCRAAAHTYLRRYPRGIFQGLASRIIKIKSDSSD